MTAPQTPHALAPRYFKAPKAQLFSAVFPGQHSVSIESSRQRRYPSLLGPAPDTRALYVAAARALSGAASVLDLGCGSGLGTAELCAHFERVTAFDTDAAAIDFVRQYLPGAHVQHDDHDDRAELTEHDAVCIVDVLGQALSPLQVLRRARRALTTSSGRLFLAELRAHPGQALLPPVVRAFSSPGLVALLACSGFDVQTWLPGGGPFLVLVAQPSADAEWQWLERAEAARAEGDLAGALRAYASLSPGAALELRVEGLLGRAALHAERGDMDAACQCLLEAASLGPGNARALTGLAEVSLLAGERAQALELSIQALERDPCELSAVQSLARAAEGIGEHDAYASWRIANGLAPADLGTAIELSRIAASRGELSYAIWVLERLRDFRSDLDADVHVTLSWLYLTANRAGEARLEAQLARVKAPESPSVHELWAHFEP